MDDEAVTLLLQRAGAGDAEAAERLYAVVYEDLRQRARALMARQGAASTLQPTAVVHEAWLKLCQPGPSEEVQAPRWRERGHFLAVASRAMRSVLVDHARARGTEKRGGDHARVVWDEALLLFDERGQGVVRLDEALSSLAEMDPELAKLVELRFFGGLTIEETARVLGVSDATVSRAWRTARAWLRAELGEEDAEEADGHGS